MSNQKLIGEKIKEILENRLENKIEIGYVNLNHEKGKGYEVDIFDNKYDYKTVSLKYIESENDAIDYADVVMYALANEGFKQHIADSLERYIIDIFDENGVDFAMAKGGEIWNHEYDNITISDIDRIEYDTKSCILKLHLDLDELVYTLDFKNKTIKEVEKLDEKLSKLMKKEVFGNKFYISNNNLWADDGHTPVSLGEIDNIDDIEFDLDCITISLKECEGGLDSFFINKYGIEM